MVKLKISDGLKLPIDAVTQRISVLGRTGSGKSHTGGVIAEEALKAHQQVVIADPKGDWWGLRSSADGKSAGLPITIMGGEHGDIPLEPTAGALVADIVINEGISVILDLSLFESKAQEIRFMEAFADRLYRKNKRPLLFIVDEADIFAPQKPEKNETVMLNRMETLCRRGRSKGIGIVLICQRSAALHKGCLSQTELMIVHQTTAPQDKKAIEYWVVTHGDEDQRNEFLERISKLPVGSAIAWSPSWLQIYTEQRIRAKETYDSSATPKVGVRRKAPKVLAQVDLERLKTHMAETIEKIRQEDPRLLRAEIVKLKAELAAKPKIMAAPVKSAPTQVFKERVVEVPALGKRQVNSLRKSAELAIEIANVLNETAIKMVDARAGLVDTGKKVTDALNRFMSIPQRPSLPPPAPLPRVRVPGPSPRAAEPAGNGESKLLAGERKMLEVLAQFHPGSRTVSQLGALAGYTPSGGTFQNYLRTLKRQALIKENHDGSLICSEAGLAYFGDSLPEAPKTLAELLTMWRSKLLAGERAMLDVLVSSHPEAITLEKLGAETNFTHTGGTFQNYLRTLKRNALAQDTEKGWVKAADALFELQQA